MTIGDSKSAAAPAGERTSAIVRPYQGFETIVLENRELQLTVVPHVGGKMVSLVRKESGREFLLQPETRLGTASYGARFEDHAPCGFDECFPTVAACEYPEGVTIPDHGEVWSRPWSHRVVENGVELAISGYAFRYELQKAISLENNSVAIRYRLENRSRQRFAYVWSAHPLLKVEQGCRILLPRDVRRVFVNWASDPALGKFAECHDWPIVRGEDLSRVQSPERRRAVKLFASPATAGCSALHYPTTDESIVFAFELDRVPHLGIWICEGGWPDTENGQYTVAIEPCSGMPDSLAEAVQRNQSQWLEPDETREWEVRIILQKGTPASLAVHM